MTSSAASPSSADGRTSPEGPPAPDGRPASPDRTSSEEPDALLPAPTVVPDGVPVSELVELTPPAQVARAALARAKAAARARGLRPGVTRTAPVGSGSAPGPRDPQPLAVSASLLARDLGWEPGLVVGDLVHRWAGIVGPEVAEHCEFVSFSAGLLTVRATSTTWATSLRYLASEMLAAFDRALGPGVVVQVEVLAPGSRGFGRGRRRVAGRGPRDTYG